MDNSRYRLVIIFIILFAAGIAGGYLYFSKKFPYMSGETPVTETAGKGTGATDGLLTLRIYYPSEGRLQMEERRAQRKFAKTAVAEAVIQEFLKGPSGAKVPDIPKDAKLLGLYMGEDGLLYVDLSDEFRRNFRGDTAAEFLLLKGLFESLISNPSDITDVKILIEGREVESLGGHLHLIYPLREIVSQTTENGQQAARP